MLTYFLHETWEIPAASENNGTEISNVQPDHPDSSQVIQGELDNTQELRATGQQRGQPKRA